MLTADTGWRNEDGRRKGGQIEAYLLFVRKHADIDGLRAVGRAVNLKLDALSVHLVAAEGVDRAVFNVACLYVDVLYGHVRYRKSKNRCVLSAHTAAVGAVWTDETAAAFFEKLYAATCCMAQVSQDLVLAGIRAQVSRGIT